MKLYLIRHGQTEWNNEGKIQGHTDIPLNAKGIRQARCLGTAMEPYPVTAIFSSPLKRAYQTAEKIAEKKGLSVGVMNELQEVDFGLWEGLTWKEIKASYPEDFECWDKNPVEHCPTGGELRKDCKKRCKNAVESILLQSKGDVVLVAHGGILVFIISYLLREQKKKREIIVKNASISVVEYDKQTGIGTLLALNEIGHLS